MPHVNTTENQQGRLAEIERGVAFSEPFKTAEVIFTPDGDASVAVITRHPEVERVSLRAARFTANGASELARLPNLLSLKIVGATITAPVLAALAKLPKLVELELGGVRATDEELKSLRFPPSLRILSLSGANLSGDALEAISNGCPDLESLAIFPDHLNELQFTTVNKLVQLKNLEIGAPVHRHWVRVLSSLQKLHSLSIRFLGDTGESPLTDLKGLTKLVICDSKLTEDDLKSIGSIDTLSHLCLDHSTFPERTLTSIGELPSLKHLSLIGTNVSDEGLERLAGLRYLVHLDLSSTQVSGTGLSVLTCDKALLELGLNGTRLSNQFSAEITQFRDLRVVYLVDVANLTQEAVVQLRKDMPSTKFEFAPRCCGAIER